MTIYDAQNCLRNLAHAIAYSKDADEMQNVTRNLTQEDFGKVKLLHNGDVAVVADRDDLARVILNGFVKCLHEAKLEPKFVGYVWHELSNVAYLESEKES